MITVNVRGVRLTVKECVLGRHGDRDVLPWVHYTTSRSVRGRDP